MVGRAKSEEVKRDEHRRKEEAFKAQAVEAYITEQQCTDSVRLRGARVIAEEWEGRWKRQNKYELQISKDYIIRHTAGSRTCKETATERRLFRPEEEDIIINDVVDCGDHGWPLSHRRLREHMDEILRARLGSDFEGVGRTSRTSSSLSIAID